MSEIQKIHQIIPAVGWYAVSDDAVSAPVPLVCWALVTKVGSHTTQIVGITDQEGFGTEPGHCIDGFRGYKHRSELVDGIAD